MKKVTYKFLSPSMFDGNPARIKECRGYKCPDMAIGERITIGHHNSIEAVFIASDPVSDTLAHFGSFLTDTSGTEYCGVMQYNEAMKGYLYGLFIF